MTVKASCPMRLERFPMDVQRCPLEVGSCEYDFVLLISRRKDSPPTRAVKSRFSGEKCSTRKNVSF